MSGSPWVMPRPQAPQVTRTLTPTPTPRPITPTQPPVSTQSGFSDFCSLENYARITARWTRAMEDGDFTKASEIAIEVGRWTDRCQ